MKGMNVYLLAQGLKRETKCKGSNQGAVVKKNEPTQKNLQKQNSIFLFSISVATVAKIM